jgi:hypothetical protein
MNELKCNFCGHESSLHTKHVDGLVGSGQLDTYSDKHVGETGSSVKGCSCTRFIHTSASG